MTWDEYEASKQYQEDLTRFRSQKKFFTYMVDSLPAQEKCPCDAMFDKVRAAYTTDPAYRKRMDDYMEACFVVSKLGDGHV